MAVHFAVQRESARAVERNECKKRDSGSDNAKLKWLIVVHVGLIVSDSMRLRWQRLKYADPRPLAGTPASRRWFAGFLNDFTIEPIVEISYSGLSHGHLPHR
jgi:hypothetical protein